MDVNTVETIKANPSKKEENAKKSTETSKGAKCAIFISKNYVVIWYSITLGVISYLLFSCNDINTLDYSTLHGKDLLFIVWIFLMLFPLIKEINVANIFSVVTRENREKEEIEKIKQYRATTEAVVISVNQQQHNVVSNYESQVQNIGKKAEAIVDGLAMLGHPMEE